MPDDRRPYAALAEIYDHVMSHVDYDVWARYVAALMSKYGPPEPDILELGCGTGSLTVRLAPDFGRRYRATDRSPEMLAAAREKLSGYPAIEVQPLDFTKIQARNRYDVILLAYDGINYVADATELQETLEGVRAALRTGGVFLFDQSTPANSINNLSYFDDQLVGDGFSYARTSSYDESTRLHVTCFAIECGGKFSTERHEQLAFTRNEMLMTVETAGFEVLASLRAFDFLTADDDSERIQWVLKKSGSRPTRR